MKDLIPIVFQPSSAGAEGVTGVAVQYKSAGPGLLQ